MFHSTITQKCLNVQVNESWRHSDGLYKLNNSSKIKRLTVKEIEQLSKIDDNFCFTDDNTLIENVKSIFFFFFIKNNINIFLL